MTAETLLLVEDNPGVRDCFCRALEDAGYLVDVVETGVGAVEHMLATPYDLVLMDLSLPDINGAEAASQARASGFTAPIIAVTGVLPLIPVERLAAAGFVAWVQKPVRISALIEVVQDWIARGPRARPRCERS